MIDPIAFHIGPLAVHWYGISYGVGLLVGASILIQLNKYRKVFKNNDQIFDFIFWLFLGGIILGGRIGYVLFYNLPFYLEHPAKILAVWDGGMSFHGGLIGCMIVGYFFTRKHKIHYLDLGDLVAVAASVSLMFTRIANFINRELVGRPIESDTWKWLGVDFGDGILRYPSQLFQAATGPVIFGILLWIFSKKPQRGILLFSYLALYGFFRTLIEFWRAPDPQIGFILGYFTLGQLFSFSMLVVGIGGVLRIKK